MLGYCTKKEAIEHGCTHNGSYYGIPCWMGDIETDCPLVFAKWAPLDYLMVLFSYVEGFIWPMIHGADVEPAFMFKVKGEIK